MTDDLNAGGRPVGGRQGTGGPPWTVPAVAALLVIEAVVVAEHARRLLAGIVTSEETLGLAALGPLDREVPAAVIEALVGLGLLVAAVAILRRSQLALAYAGIVQVLVLFEVVLRVAGGLSVLPTIALFTLAVATGALAAAAPTRVWCDVPIRS
jgi:hypothetical protein